MADRAPELADLDNDVRASRALTVMVWLLGGLTHSLAGAPGAALHEVHWGVSGEPDRYGGKAEALLLLPIAALGLYLLMVLWPGVDPGRANYPRVAAPYALLRVALLAVLGTVYVITLVASSGTPIDVQTTVSLLFGGLFVARGMVSGKIRPNWFVGVRTPWTLSSKISWTNTQRLGGWLFLAMGLGFLAAAILHSSSVFLAALAFAAVALVWIFVYSYLVWRADPERVPPLGTLPADE